MSVTGSYTCTVVVVLPPLSNPPIMYILSFSKASAISDLSIGIGAPTFQYSSVNESEDKATWEMEDDSMIIVTNRLPEVSNFKLCSGNRQ
ncbi:hypothetical protein NARC_80147 [Candidatus Nitrosocosmicus arcticus]|uniref:Uncharacterized protein n=1 Tax=Candidatus Nitrosocosmicus arcticus TaxID=2035267 RepID=A0A557SUY8_9ARCH|nr:hypothetical protein NARC_80147 [Candidatus Nitrosocosmicus arcticus]